MNGVADVHSLCAAIDAAFGGVFQQAHVGAFGRCAGDDGIKHFANLAAQQTSGGDFTHQAFDFFSGIFAFGAMRGNGR